MWLSSQKRDVLKTPETKSETKQMYLATLLENPRERSSTMQCLVKLLPVDKEAELVQAVKDQPVQALLYIFKDSASLHLQTGDVLLVSPFLSDNSDVLNPEEFDYAAYLRLRGISMSAFIPANRWENISRNETFSLTEKAKQMQLKLMSIYQSFGFDSEEFAVLAALTLGNKEFLDPELKMTYSVTGASHILAVSGLHVGVVFAVLHLILGLIIRTERFAWLKMVLLILALWVYAFITGLSPSVVRATAMFSFVCAGGIFKRKSIIYNTIAASAFLMLLFNPYYLFDISFQLSYAAVLSIVFFQNRISGLWKPSNKLIEKTWDLFTVSVAAQLGTFPFILYYFHQFPVYFWLSGFVVIPLSAVIIYSAVALFACSGIPFLNDGIAFFLNNVLKFMNFSVRLIGDFPGAVIGNISFGLFNLLLVYIILFLGAFYLVGKKYHYLFLCLCCTAFYFSIDTVEKYQKRNTTTLAVYNIPGISAINKMENGQNQLFYRGDLTKIKQKIGNFWIKNRTSGTPSEITTPYFLASNKKVLTVTDNSYKKQQPETPLPVDFLIISNNAPYSIAELSALFRFQTLIFDTSNSHYPLKKWKRQCEELGISYHIVKEQGAFVAHVEMPR